MSFLEWTYQVAAEHEVNLLLRLAFEDRFVTLNFWGTNVNEGFSAKQQGAGRQYQDCTSPPRTATCEGRRIANTLQLHVGDLLICCFPGMRRLLSATCQNKGGLTLFRSISQLGCTPPLSQIGCLR